MYNNFETGTLLRYNSATGEYNTVGTVEIELSDTSATNTAVNDILTINHIVEGITKDIIYSEDRIIRADGSMLIVRSVIKSRRYYIFECMRDEFSAR